MVAVADGHGHQTHFRSQDGARLAVQVALDLCRRAAGRARDPDALGQLLTDEVRGALVDMWRFRLDEHAAARPFTDDEIRVLGGTSPEHVRLAYGTTLVTAVVAGDALGLLQIGDGDAVVVYADGEVCQPLPEDPLLDGRRTTSLCQTRAVDSIRTGVVDLAQRPVSLAFVSTDGFGAPRLDGPGWWVQVGRELAGYVGSNGADWVEDKLADWLVEPAETGGDDTTVAILLAPTNNAGSPGPTTG